MNAITVNQIVSVSTFLFSFSLYSMQNAIDQTQMKLMALDKMINAYREMTDEAFDRTIRKKGENQKAVDNAENMSARMLYIVRLQKEKEKLAIASNSKD